MLLCSVVGCCRLGCCVMSLHGLEVRVMWRCGGALYGDGVRCDRVCHGVGLVTACKLCSTAVWLYWGRCVERCVERRCGVLYW